MAFASAGRIGGSSSASFTAKKGGNMGGCGRVVCVSTSPPHSSFGLSDQYKMLRIQPGASELEVKKAFRHLALQYHPDVCKGSNCRVQFHRINEAYDIVMTNLRASEEEEGNSSTATTMQAWGEDDDQMGGMYDSSWDLWEEWMGFEGACTRDYSSHINPYT